MANDIRLLEDLVNKAVGRLKGLTEERHQLQREVKDLQERLNAMAEDQATTGAGPSDWQAQRAQMVSELRDALDELRND